MKLLKTTINGLILIEPNVFYDTRGYFYETYNEQTFHNHGIDIKFVQDNQSFSRKNVVRGLHYQRGEFAQDKLVYVTRGAVMDVAVDIRPESPTYGQYESFLLNEINKRMLIIPKGFAHGFVALKDDTVFNYKCSNVYNKDSEGGIIWNDESIGIKWGIKDPVVSEKDQQLATFKQHV